MAGASFNGLAHYHSAQIVQEQSDLSLSSPDLDPYEHLWDVLDKQVQFKKVLPHNFQDLFVCY